MIINVYDDEGNVIKTCEAVSVKLKFGAIRSLMELLNAPGYLQTELQLDFYKTEDHLIERVFMK